MRRRGLCAPWLAAALLCAAGVQSAAAASTSFSSSLEAGDPQPTWTNTAERSSGVTGPARTGIPGNVTDTVVAVRASGENTDGGEVEENLVDGSDQSKWLVFEPTAWVELELAAPVKSYPSTYASVDLAFTDGTFLSDLGAKDQHGATLSPQGQGASKTLYTNQWNLKRSRIGKVAAGKTIDRILAAYDNPDGPADFGGWIDDIDIGPAERAPARTGSSRPAARTRAAASRAATTSRRPRCRTASTSGRRSPTRAR